VRALQIACLAAVVAWLCAGCGGGSSNPLPGWDEVAKSSSSEDGSVERARGTVERPSTFAIRVEGSTGLTAHLTIYARSTPAPG
jgi:hypothetical protein